MGNSWNTACSICPPLFSSASFLAFCSSFLFVSSPELFILASEPSLLTCRFQNQHLHSTLRSLLVIHLQILLWLCLIHAVNWGDQLPMFARFDPLSKRVSNVVCSNYGGITVGRINQIHQESQSRTTKFTKFGIFTWFTRITIITRINQ